MDIIFFFSFGKFFEQNLLIWASQNLMVICIYKSLHIVLGFIWELEKRKEEGDFGETGGWEGNFSLDYLICKLKFFQFRETKKMIKWWF